MSLQLLDQILEYVYKHKSQFEPLPDLVVLDRSMMEELCSIMQPLAINMVVKGDAIYGSVYGLNFVYTTKYGDWPCMCGTAWEQHNQCKYLFYTPMSNLKYLEEKYESKRA